MKKSMLQWKRLYFSIGFFHFYFAIIRPEKGKGAGMRRDSLKIGSLSVKSGKERRK